MILHTYFWWYAFNDCLNCLQNDFNNCWNFQTHDHALSQVKCDIELHGNYWKWVALFEMYLGFNLFFSVFYK